MPSDNASDLHILVVDDSKLSRNMAIGYLKNRLPQAQFHEAGTGEAAIELAQAHPLSLLLMDYNMPGMHGVDAAERILRLHPGLPTVLLTANGQTAVQAKAEALGIAMMKKPIKAELADQIVSMLKVCS